MSAPLLLDLTHTSHTRARTGVQRVARALHAALGSRGRAVTHDPYLAGWRTLQGWERANLVSPHVASTRGAQWPWPARLAGHLRRRWRARRALGPQPDATVADGAHGLLVPEIFSATVGATLPELFARVRGPRVAIFHDALALQLPELTPAKTVARFPAYLVELLAFDAIAAVSADSAATLTKYWNWLGAKNPPPVATLPLGVDRPPPPPAPRSLIGHTPAILCVGSIEGRKNHLALLEACRQLWVAGGRFELRLIGLAHPETGRAALQRIRELQAAKFPLSYHGAVPDLMLEEAYRWCDFTVYPSVREGFGLPVLESVIRGKPCICSRFGAVGESARGGGCRMLDRVDVPSLAHAIGELLTAPMELRELGAAAQARKIRTWDDYLNDLMAWMNEVPRRA